jgi:putative ABC transport system permease protein
VDPGFDATSTLTFRLGLPRGDVEREEPIVVVNQALVNMAFPGQDPIGKRVRFGNPSLSPRTPEWLTVAGVVANTPIFGLAEAAPFPQLYMPIFGSRRVNMAPRLDAISYVIRTRVAPASLVEPVRRVVGAVDVVASSDWRVWQLAWPPCPRAAD